MSAEVSRGLSVDAVAAEYAASRPDYPSGALRRLGGAHGPPPRDDKGARRRIHLRNLASHSYFASVPDGGRQVLGRERGVLQGLFLRGNAPGGTITEFYRVCSSPPGAG